MYRFPFWDNEMFKRVSIFIGKITYFHRPSQEKSLTLFFLAKDTS